MDTAQWPQEIGLVKPMEQRKARPQKEQALNCPRCNSTNTKFCYYNNYSLTQPRYFCKTCRRYWTEGGSLRNVPVGGGSRKNKRSSTSTSSTSASSKTLSDLTLPSYSQSSSQNIKIYKGQDLNLAFPTTENYHNISQFVQLPNIENNNNHNLAPSTTSSLSALELLRTGYTSGFALEDFKPTLNFGVDGRGGYGSLHHQSVQDSGGRLLFPFEDLRQVSSTAEFEQNRVQGDSTAYWSGMLGGGSW